MDRQSLTWSHDGEWAIFSFNDDDGGAYESWLDCFAKVNAYQNLIAIKVQPTGACIFYYFESYPSATE